jgi:hypothetical protein
VGIAVEIRVGRGESGDCDRAGVDGRAGITVVSGDCGRQRRARLPWGEKAEPRGVDTYGRGLRSSREKGRASPI